MKKMNYLLLSSALAFGISCQKDNIKPQTPTNSVETLKLEGDFKIKRASIGVKPLIGLASGFLENKARTASSQQELNYLITIGLLQKGYEKFQEDQINNDITLVIPIDVAGQYILGWLNGSIAFDFGSFASILPSRLLTNLPSFLETSLTINADNQISSLSINENDFYDLFSTLFLFTNEKVVNYLGELALSMPSIRTKEQLDVYLHANKGGDLLMQALSLAVASLQSDKFIAVLSPWEESLKNLSINFQNNTLTIAQNQQEIAKFNATEQENGNLLVEIPIGEKTISCIFKVSKYSNYLVINSISLVGMFDGLQDLSQADFITKQPYEEKYQAWLNKSEQNYSWILYLAMSRYYKSFTVEKLAPPLLIAGFDIISMINNLDLSKDFLVLTLTPTP